MGLDRNQRKHALRTPLTVDHLTWRVAPDITATRLIKVAATSAKPHGIISGNLGARDMFAKDAIPPLDIEGWIHCALSFHDTDTVYPVPTFSRRSITPITRAVGFGPLPEMLVEWESERALNKIFKAEALPLVVAESKELFVPLPSMVGVFERAGKATGRRDFGLRVGARMPYHTYGLYTQYCVQAATLIEALERAKNYLHVHQSGARFSLQTDGRHAIWRFHPRRHRGAHTHHSDHVIPPMLSLVRQYLGLEWKPPWYEADYPPDADAKVIEAVLERPVRFNRPGVGFAIANHLLRSPRLYHIGQPITASEVEADGMVGVSTEPLRTIFAITVLRLADGKTDIDGTAAMAGISVRSLQRLLNDHSLNYRSLLERVRITRARALLDDTGLTVTEIALALGYSEHANFTRAFTRWTGRSPLEHRRHNRWVGPREAEPS